MFSRIIGKHLRWQLLWVFVVGYVATASRLDAYASAYFLCTVLSLCACVILLRTLTRFDTVTLATWTALGLLLLLYYMKFYWIVLDPEVLQTVLPSSVIGTLSQGVLLHGFALVTLCFCTFSLFTATLYWVLGLQRHQSPVSDSLPGSTYRSLTGLLLVVIPPLIIGLGYVASVFNIGLLGANSGRLPLRMAGIVLYSRLILIPALLLLLIAAANRTGDLLKVRIGVVLLLVHGVMDVFVRASRGGLLTALLLLVFMFAIGAYSPPRTDRRLVMLTLLAGLATVPFITQYRWLRVSGVSVTDAFAKLLQSGVGISKVFVQGVTFVLLRLPGVEGLLSILGFAGGPLGFRLFNVISAPRGIAGYMTVELYSYPPDLPQTYSPTFLGWLYLAGGAPAIILASVALAGVVSLGWYLLHRSRLYSGPVARCFVLWILFNVLTEGTMEVIYLETVVVLAVLIGIEMSVRVLALLRKSLALSPSPLGSG